MAFLLSDNHNMDIAKVISTNFNALMAATPGLETIEKVVAASHVGYGTVRRTRNGEGNITVQHLEAIAAAFKRRAVDLLVRPDFTYEATAPVTLRAYAEPPPDERLLLFGYRQASPDVREIMLDAAKKAIARREQGKRGDHQ